LYRIGLFSKITKITVKALRFYEEEDLLKPCHVDHANGYRYYSSEQLPRAHRIVSLRQCGFSIPEIRQILAGKHIGTLFAKKQKELESAALQANAQLASINHYLENLGDEGRISHEVVIKELPAVLVYSKRMRVESYDSYFTCIPQIGEELTKANPDLRCKEDPPYCFIMYHDGEYKDADIDMEFCEAVESRGVETHGIVFKTIDKVNEAACVLHKGSYSELRTAYTAVFQWIEKNGYMASGCPRESYIDGIWNHEDPSKWLTEVQVSIIPN